MDGVLLAFVLFILAAVGISVGLLLGGRALLRDPDDPPSEPEDDLP